MLPFEDRYKYALENMRFARSSEMVAEYVYNGLLSTYNSNTRKQLEWGFVPSLEVVWKNRKGFLAWKKMKNKWSTKAEFICLIAFLFGK